MITGAVVLHLCRITDVKIFQMQTKSIPFVRDASFVYTKLLEIALV